jgi:ankyrin repeat protein
VNTERTVPVPLSTAELAELSAAFADLLNYEAEDPTTPIDPLTYRAPEGDTCLHVAAYRSDVRAVKLLLRAGLDPNAQGDMSSTPLHCASDPEVYQLLLAAGASVDAINEFGQKPKQPGAAPESK